LLAAALLSFSRSCAGSESISHRRCVLRGRSDAN
jgi:hypothetical protein